MVKRMYAQYAHSRAVELITFLGFIFGLSIALLAFVASTYFKEVIQSDNVSFFYVLIFFVILICLFKLNRIIEGFGRARTLMTLLILQIGVLFCIQFVPISWRGALLLMVYYILYGVISVVLDVVLEAYSSDGNTGTVRGIYLAVWNGGLLIGPIISVFLLERYGFDMIFTVTLLLYVVMFLIVFVALNDVQGHIVPQRLRTRKTLEKFLNKKELIHSYWMSFTLRFFYAVMTVFVPLYLREIGLSWGEIGVIFTIMLVPFVLIQYPAGLLADRKYGEKEMLFIGVVIMIMSLLCMLFIQTDSFMFWAVVLFISRIGAALFEAMQDSYFYKQITENDIAIINFFRSTRAVAYIISAAVVGVVLGVTTDLRGIFVILICVMIVGLYPIIVLKDTVPYNAS